jgi:biotin carboxylase
MPTKTYRASAFLRAALKLEFDTIIGSERRQALEAHTPGKTITLDFSDADAACESIMHFARRTKLDAIIPVDEDTAVIAALAGQAIGLPHNAPDGAIAAREKHVMRAALARHGVASPQYTLFEPHTAPEIAAASVNYPCVLKPTFLASSRGVIRVDNPQAFKKGWQRITRILAQPDVSLRGRAIRQKIIAESYIPGDEVALEGIMTGGALRTLTIFDKPDPLIGPFFEETIYVTPSRHADVMLQNLAAAAEQAAAALAIRNGPLHAEMRMNDRGIWIIEVAARSIGGLCSKALRFENDVTLEEVILRHAVGEDITSIKREAGAAGVMMIPIPGQGTLNGVTGLNQAKALSGIDDIRITIPITQAVVPMPEGDRYLGFIFSRAATPEEAEYALRAAHRLIQFDIS